VFGLAAGINRGWLDRETYLPSTVKGWEGLVDVLSPEGKVQWSQPVADHPFATAQEDTRAYTQGTFLLAAAEMYKLGGFSKIQKTKPVKQTVQLKPGTDNRIEIKGRGRA
jgi:rhamnogalacturonyl hydrolase YesR